MPKILFVGSELAPLAKVGGLADVMEGLPRAISDSGHDVSVIIPKYRHIDIRRLGAKVVVKDFPVFLAGHHPERINVYQAISPKCSVRIYLVENKKHLSNGGIYFNRSAFASSFNEIQRFLFFSKAVTRLVEENILEADIIHCNDWHAGALVSLLQNSALSGKNIKIVFTIHNLANQGIWNSKNFSA